jgi:hypothetical protein
MNSLVGTNDRGGQFIALVLEPGNLTRLKERKPIKVRIEDWFPDGIPGSLELLIAFSDTPIADAREFVKVAEMSFDERIHVARAKRPHCPECKSTIEQLGGLVNEGAPTVLYCPQCGCTLGVIMAGKDVLKGVGSGCEEG